MTPLCLFAFEKAKARFRLESVHPGHSVEEVLDNTGFAFDRDERVGETPLPSSELLALLRGTIARELAAIYPKFAERVWGIPILPAGTASVVTPHPALPLKGGGEM